VRRRILLAIVGVTAMATVLLTVPLALIIARREASDTIRELERVAQRAAAGVSTPLGSGGESAELPRVEGNVIGVYRPDGTLFAGLGPRRADGVTARARHLVLDGVVGDERVIAYPVVIDERVAAVVRVAEPLRDTTDRVRRDLLVLISFDVAAVVAAAAVGWFVAARLARPVRVIRDDAVRLGDGDFSIDPPPSGIAELDETATALAETAKRLDGMLSRERAFSADASHQLRTPLAALRLSLETELLDPRADTQQVLRDALGEIDRLEATMATLLDVARDHPVRRSPLDVDALLADLRSRWGTVLAHDGRTLRCSATGPVEAHVSGPVLDQIIDILLANAVDHGSGGVEVRLDDSSGGLLVTVGDAGHLDRDPDDLFVRRDPGASGHGVGLSLARSLAEAEGGRLVLANSTPTLFRLVLPDTDPGQGPPSTAP
jgi:signal transduction histidine kinase